MSQEQEDQDQDQERLSSVILSEKSDSIISETDIESQIETYINLSEKDKETIKKYSQNQGLLKSILKTQPSIEENNMLEKQIILYCLWILLLIVCLLQESDIDSQVWESHTDSYSRKTHFSIYTETDMIHRPNVKK